MMDFGFIEAIVWRDIVLVLAAVIGVYLVLSVMRLFQVAAKPPVVGLEQQARGFRMGASIRLPMPCARAARGDTTRGAGARIR
jgi:hypothetical protein